MQEIYPFRRQIVEYLGAGCTTTFFFSAKYQSVLFVKIPMVVNGNYKIEPSLYGDRVIK